MLRQTICAGPHHSGICFLKYFLMSGAAWYTETLTASMALKFGDKHFPAEWADQVIVNLPGMVIANLYSTKQFLLVLHNIGKGPKSPYPCWASFSSLQTLWQTWSPFPCAKKGTLHPLCSTRDTSLSPCRSPKPICILESIENHSPAETSLCRVQSHEDYFMGVHGLKWEAFESWKERFQ